MRLLSMQVQPDLAPELDLKQLKAEMKAMAKLPVVERATVDEGDDDGPYVNFNFATPDVRTLWATLRAFLYADTVLGRALRQSTMVICEGARGWDDYLLLYATDPAEVLDTLGLH